MTVEGQEGCGHVVQFNNKLSPLCCTWTPPLYYQTVSYDMCDVC